MYLPYPNPCQRKTAIRNLHELSHTKQSPNGAMRPTPAAARGPLAGSPALIGLPVGGPCQLQVSWGFYVTRLKSINSAFALIPMETKVYTKNWLRVQPPHQIRQSAMCHTSPLFASLHGYFQSCGHQSASGKRVWCVCAFPVASRLNFSFGAIALGAEMHGWTQKVHNAG